MKKTIIAAAIATVVAAPIASADVSIAGHVKQTFTKTDSTTAIDDGDLIGTTTSDLKFTATEDLGNGMTASAQMVFDMDQLQTINPAGTDTIATTQNQTVSLSGGFGTVVLGRMEDFTQSKVLAMADVFNGTGNIEPSAGAGRNNGGIAYVSPAMNGLTIGVAGFALDNAGTTGGNLNDNTFDATDIALMYSNGPLTVNAAIEDHNRVAGGTSTDDIVSIGASYVMGDLSLTAVHSATDAAGAGADLEDTAFIAKYTMGNNQIGIGVGEDETSATAATDETVVELVHNFSSRTKAFVTVYDTDAAEGDSVSFGMKHSF